MTTPAGGDNRPSGSVLVAIFLIFALGILVLGGSFTALQLDSAVTEQGENIWMLYQATLAIALVIYFGVTAGLIYAIFRFKRRSAGLPPQIHGSSALEIGWTIIPIIILVLLYVPSLLVVIDLKTPPDEADTDVFIEVIGHQWWWEFVYCNNGDCESTSNVRIQALPPDYDNLVPPALVVPTGAVVVAKVRSTDVVHSFYWPRSLYKLQAIPGNINTLHFEVKAGEEGSYSGQCYQFCGLRHSDMLFTVEAVTQSEFDSFLREQRTLQGLDTPDRATTAGD